MLTIDGSYLEGGGQIVRTAVAMSMVTGIPFRCTDIRKGRKDAGLKAQHLTAIKALLEISEAHCEGAALGTSEIIFYPKPIKKFRQKIDIGTAGSISLLLQSLLPPLLFAEKMVSLTIVGGTDGLWAVPIDYMQHVILPHLRRFATIDMKLIKRGYYPKGGGEITMKIQPRWKRSSFAAFDDFLFSLRKECRPYKLEKQKKLLCIRGISHASQDLQQARVAERQAHAAQIMLRCLPSPIKIQSHYSKTLSPGSGIVLYTLFGTDEEDIHNPLRLGGDALGEKGKKAEIVGEEAAKKLLVEIQSNAAIDAHGADNLMPYLALVGGNMHTSSITAHAKTNMHVIEQFLGKVFDVQENCVRVAHSTWENI